MSSVLIFWKIIPVSTILIGQEREFPKYIQSLSLSLSLSIPRCPAFGVFGCDKAGEVLDNKKIKLDNLEHQIVDVLQERIDACDLDMEAIEDLREFLDIRIGTHLLDPYDELRSEIVETRRARNR